MAFHVLSRGFAQAGDPVPSAQVFAAAFKRGPAAGIDALLNHVQRWNIAPRQARYAERVIQGRLAAREAARFADASATFLEATVEKLTSAGYSRWDPATTSQWALQQLKDYMLGVIAGMRQRALELESYTQASNSLERIQRSIVLLLAQAKIGYQAAEAGRGSWAGKILLLLDQAVDTAVALFEAILALLKALAEILKAAADYWPVVLAVGGGLILWWVFGGGKERARA